MPSFAALGVSPFLTEIPRELVDRTVRWAGLLDVVPIVYGVLGAPLWGQLADRFGRNRLLLRAPGGLFGSPAFFSTAGAVAAGVVAAAGSARFGSAVPVLIGSAVALLTLCATILRSLCTRWSPTCPR
ncbi:hypothetical protein [Streptomyces albicerus]|uniref:hypothetical protein n=1 Tax=Streptomyces albicerus TaxID=2569859 RepID=UPI001788BDCD|nr:hypothetical protein [Streptomyces albicerus]